MEHKLAPDKKIEDRAQKVTRSSGLWYYRNGILDPVRAVQYGPTKKDHLLWLDKQTDLLKAVELLRVAGIDISSIYKQKDKSVEKTKQVTQSVHPRVVSVVAPVPTPIRPDWADKMGIDNATLEKWRLKKELDEAQAKARKRGKNVTLTKEQEMEYLNRFKAKTESNFATNSAKVVLGKVEPINKEAIERMLAGK